MISDKQFIFIIGSLKSGTTWLQIMLGAHPLVGTTVEQTLFVKYIPSWIDIWQQETQNIKEKGFNKGLPFLWTDEDFSNFLLEFIEKVYAKLTINNTNVTHILDKNPAYTFQIELIHSLIPNAKFIHLIRDGRDTAVSMTAANKKIGYGPDNIIKASETWVSYVRAAQVAKKFQGQYLEVRYEDLLDHGEETLRSVFDFCALPITSNKIGEIIVEHDFNLMKSKRQHADDRAKTHPAFYRKGKAGNWQEELTSVQKYLVDRTAGDLLIELGYADDNWWKDPNFPNFFINFAGSFIYEKSSLQKRLYQTARARIKPPKSKFR
jgi:hypothetical protein